MLQIKVVAFEKIHLLCSMHFWHRTNIFPKKYDNRKYNSLTSLTYISSFSAESRINKNGTKHFIFFIKKNMLTQP